MPTTNLFAVNNEGRVFTLPTDQAVWQELPYIGINFKRVSVHDTVVWALGEDHQIYIYVYGTSVPIRVCEEVYENERWNPVEGFTKNLLHSDRPHLSNVDGLQRRNFKDIHLPSLAWKWEGPWHLQDTFDGKALEREGWTYALDFPRKFYADKSWSSCVRRRKWVRYRRYFALDTWSAVESIHADYTQEPFIDISVGGGDVSWEDADHLMVWAVTALGNMVMREGICRASPEGTRWLFVPLPQEAISVSVGRGGLVWAIAWDGTALFRAGITRDLPQGSSWVSVEPPTRAPLRQLSVGEAVVWGICRDSSVWFRRGVDQGPSIGTSWLQMVGALSMLSVGPNNQVWGVNVDDGSLVARTGVTSSELTGKTWRPILLPHRPYHDGYSLQNHPSSLDDDSDSARTDCQEVLQDVALGVNSAAGSSQTGLVDTVSEPSGGSPASLPNLGNEDPRASRGGLRDVLPNNGLIFQDDTTDSVTSSDGECGDADAGGPMTPCSVGGSSCDSFVPGGQGFESAPLEHRPLGEGPPLVPPGAWMWVSGSGCWVQPPNLPKWFLSDLPREMDATHEPWHAHITMQLRRRRRREIERFKGYPEAVECSSWVVTGQCRFLTGGQWVPATLELHLGTSHEGLTGDAFLKVIYSLGSKKMSVLPCGWLCLVTLTVQLPAKALLALTMPSAPLHPLQLLFSAEKDAEQWTNHLTAACIHSRGLDECPSARAIWAVSALGAIYRHDPEATERELKALSESGHVTLDVGDGSTPSLFPLERGFRPGCFVCVKGRPHDDAKRFDLELLVGGASGADIAIHFNPRFHRKVVVMNAREHNVWSYEERQPLKAFSRGRTCVVTLLCHDRDIKVSVDGRPFACFEHRLPPAAITHLRVQGDITINEASYNYAAGDRSPQERFWRGVGGHLRLVEAGNGGVTWGLSYDGHVYTYTGGAAGGIYKGSAGDPTIRVTSDTRSFHVWENERWNPVTGFSHRGLPTDRKTWSDESGLHERTKEGTRLPSRHWKWVGDWSVDLHTPGGVDRDGWQYATDFPASFHGHCYVTDLVRRRRWLRRCRVSTSGPWTQVPKVSLLALSVSPESAYDGTVPVWGISASHEVVMREGVTRQNPRGTHWSLISSETTMKDISAGVMGGVWAVCCSGQAHIRIGVSKANPKGGGWANVDAPGVPLRQVAAGNRKVWAVDRDGNLYYRVNVQINFPEGTEWKPVCKGVDLISVAADGSLGAILRIAPNEESLSGILALRKGISDDNPGGTEWEIFCGTGWSHFSARIPFLE